MEHILESPAWHALNSGNKNLGLGNDKAKYFNKEVSPFAAMEANTPENFQLLYEVFPDDRPALFMSSTEIEIPRQWEILDLVKGIQMVCERPVATDDFSAKPVPLTEVHVPQMLVLTRLTNPGPFANRTIDFGHYFGIFEGNELVAMAGQRLHAYQFAEISAVCTHPHHTGKGYAYQLVQHQAKRIQLNGFIPYLHVRANNSGAIRVYQKAGFEQSRDMFFYVLKKG